MRAAGLAHERVSRAKLTQTRTCGTRVCDRGRQELAAGLAASVQYRLGPREVMGLRATWNNRGRGGMSLR